MLLKFTITNLSVCLYVRVCEVYSLSADKQEGLQEQWAHHARAEGAICP